MPRPATNVSATLSPASGRESGPSGDTAHHETPGPKVQLEPYDQGYRDGWADIHVTRRQRRKRRRLRSEGNPARFEAVSSPVPQVSAGAVSVAAAGVLGL